jgi:hypothetical protein
MCPQRPVSQDHLINYTLRLAVSFKKSFKQFAFVNRIPETLFCSQRECRHE